MNSYQILQDIKAKATKPRLLVLDVLLKSTMPISADLIVKKTKLNKVSVYRIIDFLVKKSLVKVIELRQSKALFTLSKPCAFHYIICLKCKKIEKINICLFNELESKVLKISNFKEITDHSMEFFGLCANCYNKN